MAACVEKPIIIAGGGIGGLATALTLHQLGLPFVILESTPKLRPLGVGINLQPNAVKELFDLGITRQDLESVGISILEWALVGLNGRDIYAETRGEAAGYNWPQFAVHRGRFHQLLLDAVRARAGDQAVRTDRGVVGYEQSADSVTVTWRSHGGKRGAIEGSVLIGADGIRSAVRAQMHPADRDVHWGGALMWRGTSRARPLREGCSFVGFGTHDKRVVLYPISPADPKTGLAEINWIAEITVNPDERRGRDKWFSPVPTSSFAHHFADWKHDWLDVPALILGAPQAFENPMIDRHPLPYWHSGRVALLGDAAHAMYPTGSNGASQALVDARVLGAALQTHGVSAKALAAYGHQLCAPISALQLRNREDGPFGILKEIDRRCGGFFEDIDQVMPAAERSTFMADYKTAAGFDKTRVNSAPPTLLPLGQ